MYPVELILLTTLAGLTASQRHLGFRDPWEPFTIKERARAFKKSLEDIKPTKGTFDALTAKDIYDSTLEGGLNLLRANENAKNSLLQFIDPINGGKQFFKYNPIPRRNSIAPYYRREGQSLSELSIFPGQSSLGDDEGPNDKQNFANPQDNSYFLDNKFFSDFKKSRQNKFLRNSKPRRMSSRTSSQIKAFPVNLLWDNIIMHLLRNWESQQ